MKTLITGASGFIGSHLADSLKRHETVTLVRDLFPTETPWGKWLSHALNKTTIVLGDILNFKTVKRILAEYNIDTVFHLAAQAIVSTAQKDPTTTIETNVQGTANILEACRQTDVETIYVQSTDKVYGEKMNAKEEDPLVSTGIYETSKAMQDLLAQAYAKTCGMNITIGRASCGMNIIIGRACNCYGYDLAKRIISNTIRSCLKGEPPVIFEGQEHTVRQYIYVEDLVDAIKHLIIKKAGGIYNIATDDILTQEQVVKKICNYFPLTPRLAKREKPLKEIQTQSMNWNKLKTLGWKPKFTFEEGVKTTIERFRKYGY